MKKHGENVTKREIIMPLIVVLEGGKSCSQPGEVVWCLFNRFVSKFYL